MTDTHLNAGSPAAVAGDKEVLKQKAIAAKDAVAELAGEAKNYASHRVSDARETASGWVDSAKGKASDLGDNVVEYIQRKPFQSIGIALGIGFVAGLILKRR
jgi:ElaB/YqjD/DUF883 family membrane-anchored ribosome-binding protein